MAIGMMNEEHELLMSYQNIPKTVTVTTYTTEMEQLRLSSENFHQVMIEKILPQVLEPEIPVKELYEVDYYLLLRHLRLMTWGPMFTVGTYFCNDCLDVDGTKGRLWKENRQVRLDTVDVILPDKGEKIPVERIVTPDELVFTDAEVRFTMNRCRELLLIEKTKVKDVRKHLLPMAAAIREVTGTDFIDITEAVDWIAGLPAVDFKILQDAYNETFGYGLSTRGTMPCPKCGGKSWFYAPINDYYFRPDRENIQEWIRILHAAKKSKKSS